MTQAQSILRRLERAARTTAERTAERKVEEKVEEGVSKALDEAFEESEKKEQKDGQEEDRDNKADRSTARRAVQNQDLEFDDWDMEAEDLEMMKRTGQNGSYRRDSGTSGNNNSSQRSAGQTSGNASRRASDQDSRSGLPPPTRPGTQTPKETGTQTPKGTGTPSQTRDKTIPKTEGLRWNGPNPTLWPGMRSFLKTTWLGNSLANFLPTGILLKEMQRLCVLTVKTPSCCSMMPG